VAEPMRFGRERSARQERQGGEPRSGGHHLAPAEVEMFCAVGLITISLTLSFVRSRPVRRSALVRPFRRDPAQLPVVGHDAAEAGERHVGGREQGLFFAARGKKRSAWPAPPGGPARTGSRRRAPPGGSPGTACRRP
jgi:hypothetical protein